MTAASTRPGLHANRLPVALRDTASTVAALRGDAPPSPERQDTDAQIAGLRETLRRQGHPTDVIDDAFYAQCALLDEAALAALAGGARDAWAREPLQVRVFGRNDAGDELLRRIDARLREATPVLPLLAIFASVLGLGFRGRHAVADEAARASLVEAIDDHLARSGTHTSNDIMVNRSGERRAWPSPILWVCLAAVTAGLVWLAIDRWLLSSIANLSR